jgi:ABC-type transport system substrate-binding protein
MKKKMVALMLSILMILPMAIGCASKEDSISSNDDVSNGNNVTTNDADTDGNGRYDLVALSLASDPGDLNPWDCLTAAKNSTAFCIYDTLFDIVEGKYISNVAKSYTQKDDLHWEVQIYDYVYDWNGNKITADDIVACYNRYKDSGYAHKFNAFQSISKVDDYTVEFTWNEPITKVGVLDHIFCNVQIYSEKEFEKGNFANAPVATGPYTLVSYVPDSKVIVKANDNYWQTDASLISPTRVHNVDTIEFHVVSEPSQNVIGLQSKTLDFSMQIPDESLEKFEDGGKFGDDFNTYSFLTTESYFITCNNSEDKLTADLNLRLAIFYAIDNGAISKLVAGTLPCKAFGSAATPDYVDSWEAQNTYFNTCDPELAKEYLQKSGYSGEELVLEGSNTEVYKSILQVIQACLKSIDINCRINAIEDAQHTSNASVSSEWDIYLAKCGGTLTASAYNRLLNNGEYGGEYCLGFIKDDRLQSLFETASTQATWNDDSMTDVFNHVTQNAYAYTLVSNNFNVVYTENCTNLYTHDINILPNACTYKID